MAERWRSMGLIIGAIATADAPEQPPPDPREPPKAMSAVPPAPSVDADKKTTSRLWFDAGGVGGPALDHGRWRAGMWIGVAWAPLRIPAALVASVRYESRFSDGGDFDLTLGSGSLGVLGFARFGSFVLEGRVEMLRRILVVSAADEARGVGETRHRWETGVRAGGDIVAPLGESRFSMVAGADATYVGEGTAIAVSGQRVGRLPSVAGSALLGLRYTTEGTP
jgi:hypothetical protein